MKHFNPFALRLVRFAVNLLINRRYVANDIVGAANVVYVALSKYVTYYNETVLPVVKKLGLKPEGDEDRAREIIEQVFANISKKLAEYGYELYKSEDGYWYFKAPNQSAESVTINIVTWWESYVYHCGATKYLAKQLEELGFKVNVECTHARKYRDSKDWRYMHLHIYTYRRVVSEDLAKLWYVDGMYWIYSSAAIPTQLIESLSPEEKELQKLIDGTIESMAKAKTTDQFLDLARKAIEAVINQSIVVAFTELVNSILISKSKTVKNAVTGWASGIQEPWIYRAVQSTERNYVVIGVYEPNRDLLHVVNPRVAMNLVSTARLLMPVVDAASFSNPYTGNLTGLRVAWSVQVLGKGALPKAALFYGYNNHSWITVEEAIDRGLLDADEISNETIVKVVYRYALGMWHHGREMKLYDIIFWITWGLEWWYNSGDGDVWHFDEAYEHPMHLAHNSYRRGCRLQRNRGVSCVVPT